MNLRAVAVPAAALAAVGALIAWRVAAPATPTTHAALLFDRSGSATGGCDSLVGALGSVLSGPLGKRSTVAVLATGDEASAGEPVDVLRLTGLSGARSIEGGRAATRRRAAALSSVGQACSELPPGRSSPILLGVRRAVQGLRARGCKEDSGCHLVVVSDLEENGDAQLAARIRGRRGAGAASAIDNAGIDILLCGVSDTRGPSDGKSRGRVRSSSQADRIEKAWRAEFTAPGLVRFEPHCPRGAGRPEQRGDR